MSAPQEAQGRLANFPISFFAMIMGITGLAIAWEKAQHVFGVDLAVGQAIMILATILFAALLLAYGAKVVRYRARAVAELHHPIKLAFFPTISISFLLLSIAFLGAGDGGPTTDVARVLWFIGAGMHLVLTFLILGMWMHRDHFRVEHLNPAWFIPAVGNVVVPVAGVPLGFVELSWFFFAAGVMSWIILLTIVINRIIFHETIERRLLPSFFILVAPPAVAFIAWTRLNGGELDGVGRVLYYFGLFLALLLFTQAGRFLRLPFGLPSWAFAFPLASLAIATLLMYEKTGTDAFLWGGAALLALVTVVVMVLLAQTALGVAAGRICAPDRPHPAHAPAGGQ